MNLTLIPIKEQAPPFESSVILFRVDEQGTIQEAAEGGVGIADGEFCLIGDDGEPFWYWSQEDIDDPRPVDWGIGPPTHWCHAWESERAKHDGRVA